MARHFKSWLGAYLTFTKYSEAPGDFHFWTGVSTIAGALRRRVWIDQRHFEWTPNFYIVFVAPPGIATKSTTIGIGHGLLREVEGVNFGPASATWQALTESIASAAELVPLTPGDFEGEVYPMSCITLGVSELGTLMDMDNPQLINVLIDLWDGKKTIWEHKTRTQGSIVIENPWINMIGATTPDWIRKNFTESTIGGGLTSRIIFIYGDNKRQLVAYPGDTIDAKENQEFATKLIEDLRTISQLIGEYTLTPDAKEWGTRWYNDHWTSIREGTPLADKNFGGYVARKQTHIHKLAIVVAASRRDELVITLDDLQFAAGIITATEPHLQRVTKAALEKDSLRQQKTILTFLAMHKGKYPAAATMRYCMNSGIPIQDYYRAVEALVHQKSLVSVRRQNDIWYEIIEENLKEMLDQPVPHLKAVT